MHELITTLLLAGSIGAASLSTPTVSTTTPAMTPTVSTTTPAMTPGVSMATEEAPPAAVSGVATIAAGATTANVTWILEQDGKRVETTIPPKMRVTRIATSVPHLMVRFPTDIFAIKIGPDMLRIFDEPVLLQTDQLVTCSCRMRPDCGADKSFRCEIEGTLED